MVQDIIIIFIIMKCFSKKRAEIVLTFIGIFSKKKKKKIQNIK